jgi:hypothetical protein
VKTVKKLAFQKETLHRLDQDPLDGPINFTSDPCDTTRHTNGCSIGLNCATC